MEIRLLNEEVTNEEVTNEEVTEENIQPEETRESAKESDLDRAFYLSAQAFSNGARDMSRVQDPNRMPRDTYGIFDAQGLQAKIAVLQYHVYLGSEVVVPMGGIGGVACLPASRGQGYVGAGLDYVLERMREKGQLISVLYPFSWEFYGRYGWAWVGEEREYSVPPGILTTDPETRYVRAAVPGDRDKIVKLYTRYAHGYRGMIARIESQWNQILQDSQTHFTYTYLYEREGSVEGYLTYRGGTRQETRLREFQCTTPRAVRALLGLLHRHDMQIDKFTWAAPNDDNLRLHICHWEVETKVQARAMGRVVDLQAALTAWKPYSYARGEAVLAIHDAHAPWNEGRWHVEFEAGQVSVTATSLEPDVEMDIQAFTQSYLGTPSLQSLRSAGRLTAYSESGYAGLCALLDGPVMWINDGF